MKYLLTVLSLLIAVPAFAKEDEKVCKWVKICVPKKKKHPAVIAAPLARVVEVPAKCPPPGVMVVYRAVGCPEHDFVVGGHVSLGLGVQDPYVSGRVGLRLYYKPWHIGLDVSSYLQYGIAFEGLVYPYQGKRVSVNLALGAMITGSPFAYISDKDIVRRVDLRLGAGLEVKLVCHLDLLLDWRVSLPDPAKLAGCQNCVNGQRLDSGKAVGNAFAESQLYVGLLVH